MKGRGLFCCVCHCDIDKFAGDPGKWPVMFGHMGGNGATFVHCGECCAKMHAEYMIGRDVPTAKSTGDECSK